MIVRLIVQTFIWFGAMGIPLFLAAGTFAWPGAWDYLVLMVALSFTLGIDLARCWIRRAMKIEVDISRNG